MYERARFLAPLIRLCLHSSGLGLDLGNSLDWREGATRSYMSRIVSGKKKATAHVRNNTQVAYTAKVKI